MKKLIFMLFSFYLSPSVSHGIATEIGVSYSQRKNTFDTFNYNHSETTTGTISFYFWERIAWELSYSNGVSVRGEKAGSSDPQRITLQKTEVKGTDLILILAGKTSLLQPFIKGGVAQISRRQEIKIDTLDNIILAPEIAVVPSYGAGFKIRFSENMSVKVGYDVWQTPIGENAKVDDSMINVGMIWML